MKSSVKAVSNCIVFLLYSVVLVGFFWVFKPLSCLEIIEVVGKSSHLYYLQPSDLASLSGSSCLVFVQNSISLFVHVIFML